MKEGKVGQALTVEIGFHGLDIRQAFVMALIPFLVLRNSKFSSTTFFSCFEGGSGWRQMLGLLGRSTCFASNCLLTWRDLGGGSFSVHFSRSEGGEEIPGDDLFDG
jgi:hypothetical protein